MATGVHITPECLAAFEELKVVPILQDFFQRANTSAADSADSLQLYLLSA